MGWVLVRAGRGSEPVAGVRVEDADAEEDGADQDESEIEHGGVPWVIGAVEIVPNSGCGD
jgi:hypothetical protein